MYYNYSVDETLVCKVLAKPTGKWRQVELA